VADKPLGALPVVADFARRLDLAGIVDRACPVRDLALLTHGQVIEALVANRLTSPAPLVHVEDWAREWAVQEIFESPLPAATGAYCLPGCGWRCNGPKLVHANDNCRIARAGFALPSAIAYSSSTRFFLAW
jgi:hypothetical protein